VFIISPWLVLPRPYRSKIPLNPIGYPQLGSVSLSEIAAVRGPLGLPIERDVFFEANKSLGAYAAEASALGHIAA
jgi:hypothetical protein